MTTAKTVKALHKAFAAFESDIYVQVETVCRESASIPADRSEALMDAMRAAHRQLRITLSEAERLHAQEKAK